MNDKIKKMSFYDVIGQYDWQEVGRMIHAKTTADVNRALHAQHCSLNDFMALVSPAADGVLESMAQKSRQLTLRRFGKTIQLYVPLYVSNFCENHCVYCGFKNENHIRRKVLHAAEVKEEAAAIRQLEFEHLLLVSGESPKKAGVDYYLSLLDQLAGQFAQISLEVQPLDTDDYRRLCRKGLHAVYIYQETYREATYGLYHPAGRKANYRYRLETPDRLGAAGIHKIGLGNLIGLEEWRTEAFFTALHLFYLRKKFWKTKYSIAFPRLRPFAGAGFQPKHPINERQLVQLICAYRLFDENVELSLSTRESAKFRDQVLPLGITAMSAGSSTEPGGYAHPAKELAQFTVCDARSPKAVVEAIRTAGYETVWKDWDGALQTIQEV